MGSRILSRSFHVEEWQSQDVTVASLDSERIGDGMEVDTPTKDPVGEDRSVNSDSDSEDDEDVEDPADVAMVPIADILNARYGSENVSFDYVSLQSAGSQSRHHFRRSSFTKNAIYV